MRANLIDESHLCHSREVIMAEFFTRDGLILVFFFQEVRFEMSGGARSGFDGLEWSKSCSGKI